MSQETFFNYRKFRWLWLNIGLVLILGLVYLLDHPIGGKNGGTVLGYTYGIIAALGILVLMAFGGRKRAYHSTVSTVQGWLAVHIWLGIALVIIVPMHCGFSFGVNVHTLAYVLMLIVIASGIWGAVNYAVLSREIESHRGGGKASVMVEEVLVLSEDIEKAAATKSDAVLAIVHTFDFPFKPKLSWLINSKKIAPVDKKIASELLLRVPQNERDDALRIMGLIDQKFDITSRLIKEARIKALLKFWLYIHVPVSVGLLVTLAIHIFSVFFYW